MLSPKFTHPPKSTYFLNNSRRTSGGWSLRPRIGREDHDNEVVPCERPEHTTLLCFSNSGRTLHLKKYNIHNALQEDML